MGILDLVKEAGAKIGIGKTKDPPPTLIYPGQVLRVPPIEK